MDPNLLQTDSEDSDQTENIPMLILAGRIGHFVGFVVLQLIYHLLIRDRSELETDIDCICS